MLSQLLTFEESRNCPVIVHRFYQNTYQNGGGMYNARLWFARIIVAYALLIFTYLAYLYIFEPLEHIAIFWCKRIWCNRVYQFSARGTRCFVFGNGLVRCLRTGPAGTTAQLFVGVGGLQRLRGRRTAFWYRGGRQYGQAAFGTSKRRIVMAAIRGFVAYLPTSEITAHFFCTFSVTMLLKNMS